MVGLHPCEPRHPLDAPESLKDGQQCAGAREGLWGQRGTYPLLPKLSYCGYMSFTAGVPLVSSGLGGVSALGHIRRARHSANFRAAGEMVVERT
jgi:hypothetical protein